jgi:hypothetical protein
VWKCGCTAPLTFDLATACDKLYVPALYPRVEAPVHTERGTGWAPEFVWGTLDKRTRVRVGHFGQENQIADLTKAFFTTRMSYGFTVDTQL